MYGICRACGEEPLDLINHICECHGDLVDRGDPLLIWPDVLVEPERLTGQ